jgi:HK97 family phage portal protein
MALFTTRTAEAPQAELRSMFAPFNFGAGGTFADTDAVTGDGSLQSVAVRSTVDLICSLGSELPVDVFRDRGTGRSSVKTPTNLLDPGGDDTGLEDWVYRLLSSWALRGNAYGVETSWDRKTGRATTVDLFHPDDVSVNIEGDKPTFYVSGKLADPDTFVHWRVNPMAGRVLGLSPVALHAATVGVSLSSTRFGAQWFRDGAHPGGLLKNSEANLNAADAKTAKERFIASLRGTREPLVLGKGWEYQTIQVSPEESQFLETQGFTEAQCARMFGPGFAEVMGYESGGSMTYSNIVDRRQDLLVFSMNKWLRRTERVLSSLIPKPHYVRLNRDAMLEATTLDRYTAHASALQNRWRTVNEVRAMEDLPPVEWGNEPNVTAKQPDPKEVPDGDADGI